MELDNYLSPTIQVTMQLKSKVSIKTPYCQVGGTVFLTRALVPRLPAMHTYQFTPKLWGTQAGRRGQTLSELERTAWPQVVILHG